MADDGRVEICLDGLWSSVCGFWWNYNAARVVCRELGYDGRKFIYLPIIMSPVIHVTPYFHQHMRQNLLVGWENRYSVIWIELIAGEMKLI